MRGIEDILARCVEDVEGGRATVEDCLARNAAVREELEPLLRMAVSIDEPAGLDPQPAFKMRARANLIEQIHAEQTRKEHRWSVFGGAFGRPAFASGSRVLAAVMAAVIAVSAVGGGTAYAAQDSLPGDTLYSVKLGTESIRRLVTADASATVDLELSFAGTRLEELEAVVDRGPAEMAIAISKYEKNIDLAELGMEELADVDTDGAASEALALAMSNHLATFADIEDEAPEGAKAAVVQASDRLGNRQVWILRVLSRRNPVRAAEIGLHAMDCWLRRAETSGEGDVEAQLGQFRRLQELGDEISMTVDRDSIAAKRIGEMRAVAATRHLAVLEGMLDRVPGPFRAAVEKTLKASVETHSEFVRSPKEAGVLGSGFKQPQPPNTVLDNARQPVPQS